MRRKKQMSDRKKNGGCRLCSRKAAKAALSASADKLAGMSKLELPTRKGLLSGPCCSEAAYHNPDGVEMAGANSPVRYKGEADASAQEGADMYEDSVTDSDGDSDSDTASDSDSDMAGFDEATGLPVDALKDGSFFKNIAAAEGHDEASDSSSTATTSDSAAVVGLGLDAGCPTQTLTTESGEAVQCGVTESVGLGGAGGPEAAVREHKARKAKKQNSHRWREKMMSKHDTTNNALDLDGAEAGGGVSSHKPVSPGAKQQTAKVIVMEGHESYNLNTIVEYVPAVAS